MAPSGMFSYLRSNHKRASPPPKLAVSVPTTSPPSTDSLELRDANPEAYPPRISFDDSPDSNSSVSPFPPVLPPIPRVASRSQPSLASKSSTFGTGEARERKAPKARSDAHRAQDGGQTRSQLPAPDSRLKPALPSLVVHPEDDQEWHYNTYERLNSPDNGNHHRPGTSSSARFGAEKSRISSPGSPSPFLSNDTQHFHFPISPPETNPFTSRSTEATSRPNSSHQPRPGKTKLNLLNPMSLLLRRRSSQALSRLADHSSNKVPQVPALQLPDDYDPRIRGKGVHDFSAPKSKKSYPRKTINSSAARYTGSPRSPSPSPHESTRGNDQSEASENESARAIIMREELGTSSRIDEEHNPTFEDHFSEDRIRQLPVGTQEYRLRENDTPDNDDEPLQNVVSPPTVPRRFTPNPHRYSQPSDRRSRSRYEPIEPNVLKPPERKPPPIPPANPTAEESGSAQCRSMTVPTTESSYNPTGIRKHRSSNASRFSFDLIGGGSATQEKILEDNHRNKILAKTVEDTSSDYDSVDEEIYDFDPDGDDGAFEEKIPGVNTDADEDVDCDEGGGEKPMDSSIDQFNFRQQSSPSTSYPHSFPSPETSTYPKVHGRVTDDAVSFESSTFTENAMSSVGEQSPYHTDQHGIDVSQIPSKLVPKAPHTKPILKTPNLDVDDDDLYYDDGLIEHMEPSSDHEFNESLLDHRSSLSFSPSSNYGVDLTSGPENPAFSPKSNFQQQTNPTVLLDGTDDHTINTLKNRLNDDAVNRNAAAEDRVIRGAKPPYIVDVGRQRGHEASSELTQNNLEAYHSALAAAANAAADKGDFARRDATSSQSPEGVETSNFQYDTNPLCVSGDTKTNPFDVNHDQYQQPFVSTYENGFDDDVDLNDDPMVSAANAEALANDYDGIYGQEFGFYYHSNGTNETQYENGGYFGPSGADGITRSQSNRFALREPNLTPITERSEFSNRNSFISLPLSSAQTSQQVQSPGLAQLSSLLGPFEGDDLTLSGLLKLRRGAWAGSNGSLHSIVSTGSPANSSPLSYLASSHPGKAPPEGSPEPLAGSRFSLASSDGGRSGCDMESERGSSPISPTVTMASHLYSNGYQSEVLSSPECSPVKSLFRRDREAHSRTTSFADSVSYMTEEDEAGEKRWVLERRRTAETGEVEVIGREIVERGRI
ncbi:MAG: hypothetical protein M1837_004421 [Sclerophora amabilis]|nr:MAG: hypothetical protein M1837_004421 [Sclerophora amabilis]